MREMCVARVLGITCPRDYVAVSQSRIERSLINETIGMMSSAIDARVFIYAKDIYIGVDLPPAPSVRFATNEKYILPRERERNRDSASFFRIT